MQSYALNYNMEYTFLSTPRRTGDLAHGIMTISHIGTAQETATLFHETER